MSQPQNKPPFPPDSSGHRRRILALLGGDVAAAAISATFVAPTIAIIDRAVVEKVAHRQPFLRSLWSQTKFAASRPRQFVVCKPFGIIWTLYAVTYTVASGSETIAKNWLYAAAGTITFLATTAVNVPLGVWKDVQFARIYGGPGKPSETIHLKSRAQPDIALVKPTAKVVLPPRGLPLAATSAFLLRDSLTIFGSFTLAPRLSNLIPNSLVAGPHTKATISQLTVPVLTQLVATPIHLIGLDMYNRQEQGVSLPDRVSRVQKYLASSTLLRCVRILPAFGFGIIANTELRSYFHETFTIH